MAIALSRRGFTVNSIPYLSKVHTFCSKFLNSVENGTELSNQVTIEGKEMDSDSLSLLLSSDRPRLDAQEIQVVDDDVWRVSSGLAQGWGGMGCELLKGGVDDDWIEDRSLSVEGDSDFDEIDNMRIRGNLFYKLERSSKEFEEYSFEFHRRKSSQKNERSSKGKENDQSESKKKQTAIEKLPKVASLKTAAAFHLNEMRSLDVEKTMKVRTQTFNQLTGPYHEPFCLDIFISKASVRACIVHRVTSKVVAVAHSISKDMKYDLASTRNAAACAAVGVALAQRALGDDIHDIIYTPRKGEKIEGKLQIVLQSIIDNGINVKVKLRQRKPRKDGHHPTLSGIMI